MNDHVAELRRLKEDRTFGIGVGVFGCLLTLLGHWKGWWSLPPSAAAGILMASWTVAVLFPPFWRPLRSGWMSLGRGLGWFNSRVIYSLAFLLLFAPVAVLVRLFGEDPLDPREEEDPESYWITRPPPPSPRSYLEPH